MYFLVEPFNCLSFRIVNLSTSFCYPYFVIATKLSIINSESDITEFDHKIKVTYKLMLKILFEIHEEVLHWLMIKLLENVKEK